MSAPFGPNQELYNRLNVPFENRDKASTAFKAFFEDVAAAREKHGILNAGVVVSANTHDGGEVVAMGNMFFYGNAATAEALFNQALIEAMRKRIRVEMAEALARQEMP